MAQKPDIAAAKARKQKFILGVAGVLLVAMAVIQVPKLMKKSDSQPAAASASTAAPAAAETSIPTAVVVVNSTTAVPKPAAYVAGVALPGGTTVVVAKSQLASFTLFEAKDPFVQQVGDETGTDQAPVAAVPSTDAAAPASASDPTSTADAGTSTAPPPPAPVVYATVMFDGKPQQLQVKQKFPKGEPLFVLVSLKKKQAKIAVAGGSFDDGNNVTLTLGKKLTLLDTATGVRYELKLVYTGSTPEQIEGFSTKTDQPSTPAGGASTVSVIPAADTP